jgi:hypothetical protein
LSAEEAALPAIPVDRMIGEALALAVTAKAHAEDLVGVGLDEVLIAPQRRGPERPGDRSGGLSISSRRRFEPSGRVQAARGRVRTAFLYVQSRPGWVRAPFPRVQTDLARVQPGSRCARTRSAGRSGSSCRRCRRRSRS